MNYLAHLLLSDNDEKIMVGNFIADWVKGSHHTQYPLGIQKGILMHRAIDSFTDQHPLHKHSRSFFAPSYGKFSGIVVDVLFDHFLSVHWLEYCKTNRTSFIEHSYDIMSRYRTFFPPRPKRLLSSIIHHDWMGAYVSFSGLEKVLQRMSRRTSLPPMTNDAIITLRLNYPEIDNDFKQFFKQLQDYVKEWNENYDIQQNRNRRILKNTHRFI